MDKHFFEDETEMAIVVVAIVFVFAVVVAIIVVAAVDGIVSSHLFFSKHKEQNFMTYNHFLEWSSDVRVRAQA